MEYINRDDALFNMINKHSTDMEEQRKEENRRQEIIQHNFMHNT